MQTLQALFCVKTRLIIAKTILRARSE